jgi:hypothetical protein
MDRAEITNALGVLPVHCRRPSQNGGWHAIIRQTDGEPVKTQDLAHANDVLLAEIRGVSVGGNTAGAYAQVTGPGRGQLAADFAPAEMSSADVVELLDQIRAVDDGTGKKKVVNTASLNRSAQGEAPAPPVAVDDAYQARVQKVVEAIIAKQIDSLTAGVKNNRNNTLNNTALRCFRLYIGAGLDTEPLADLLLARILVKDPNEARCRTTIESAFAGATRDGPAHIRDQADVDAYMSELGQREGVDTGTDVEAPMTDAERFRLIDWDTFWNKEREGVEWLLEPIIAKGRQTTIYSAPKVGKSLLMLWFSVMLATDETNPRRVLYVDHENTEDDIAERMESMGWKGLKPERLTYSLLGEWEPLDTDRGGRQLAALAKRTGSEIVIIDTATRTVEGNENEADTWKDWYKHSGVRLKRLDCAVVRLDHSGKDASKGMRGSSSKASDVDLVVRMTPAPSALICEVEANRVEVKDKKVAFAISGSPLAFGVVVGKEALDELAVAVMVNRLEEHQVPFVDKYDKVKQQARDEDWTLGRKADFLKAQKLRIALANDAHFGEGR